MVMDGEGGGEGAAVSRKPTRRNKNGCVFFTFVKVVDGKGDASDRSFNLVDISVFVHGPTTKQR